MTHSPCLRPSTSLRWLTLPVKQYKPSAMMGKTTTCPVLCMTMRLYEIPGKLLQNFVNLDTRKYPRAVTLKMCCQVHGIIIYNLCECSWCGGRMRWFGRSPCGIPVCGFDLRPSIACSTHHPTLSCVATLIIWIARGQSGETDFAMSAWCALLQKLQYKMAIKCHISMVWCALLHKTH